MLLYVYLCAYSRMRIELDQQHTNVHIYLTVYSHSTMCTQIYIQQHSSLIHEQENPRAYVAGEAIL